MRPFLAINCAVALLMTGCAGAPKLEPRAGLQVTEMSQLPAPTGADMTNNERPYLIGPFDKLNIDVFGVEDLSRDVQADASGRVSIPLAGTLDVSGKTPGEVATMVADRLRGRYVRDPQVTVNLLQAVSRIVTIDGEVKKPGLYPVVGQMTLMRAVATAEGTTEFARLDDVVVFRTVKGQRYAALFNLKAIRRGTYEDPEIFPNDVISVGDSQARRLFRDVLTAAPAIVTPLVYVLSRN